jgi:hypothetical protein
MSRPIKEYSFQSRSAQLKGVELIGKEITNNASSSDESLSRFESPLVKTLENFLGDIIISCGGEVTYGEITMPARPKPKDKDIILTFDALCKFTTTEGYTPRDLAKIDRGIYRISHLYNFIHGNEEYLRDFIERKEIDIPREYFSQYCELVASSSKKLVLGLTKWLALESEIEAKPYIANIESSKRISDDEKSIFDQIREDSTFLSFKGRTLESRPAETSSKSGNLPKPATSIAIPTGSSLYERSAAHIAG